MFETHTKQMAYVTPPPPPPTHTHMHTQCQYDKAVTLFDDLNMVIFCLSCLPILLTAWFPWFHDYSVHLVSKYQNDKSLKLEFNLIKTQNSQHTHTGLGLINNL